MRPVFARGNQQTAKILLELRKQALKDDEPRVAQRFHAVALSIEGYTSQRIAQVLKVHRSSVPLWIENWNQRREAASGGRGRIFDSGCERFAQRQGLPRPVVLGDWLVEGLDTAGAV